MRKIAYIENFESWKDEFTFSVDIKIRFSETDMFGHMNNVSPFIYFEEARIEFLKHIGLFTKMSGTDTIPIVADLQCDYHKQVFFGDTLKMFVKTNSIGRTSLDVHYMALDGKGDVCLTGRGSMVNVEPKSGRPQPLSNMEKKKLLEIY